MNVKFEYHLNKSEINQTKHGINFEEARKLWQDPFLLRIPSKYEAEKRYLFIGKIEQKHWSAIALFKDYFIPKPELISLMQ